MIYNIWNTVLAEDKSIDLYLTVGHILTMYFFTVILSLLVFGIWRYSSKRKGDLWKFVLFVGSGFIGWIIMFLTSAFKKKNMSNNWTERLITGDRKKKIGLQNEKS